MTDEKFQLTLIIDGHKYPLKILRSEEEAFRKAEKQINTKINQYRAKFGGNNSNLTSQDFMAMTAIQALVENFTLGDKNYTKPYDERIQLLVEEMDIYMREQ